VNGKNRIKKVCQADTMGFGHQAKQGTIAIETPGPSLLNDTKALLIASIEKFVCHPAGGGLVGEFQGFGAIPLNTDNGDKRVWKNAANGSVNLKVFESKHQGPFSTLEIIFCALLAENYFVKVLIPFIGVRSLACIKLLFQAVAEKTTIFIKSKELPKPYRLVKGKIR
jgi:hypothetical protein